MTGELRYMLKTNSDCEACSDQESLRALIAHLRMLADDLHLDFARANFEAGTSSEWTEMSTFCPSI